MVRPLLQLSERWPCHIRLVDGVKFASHEANVGRGPFILSHFLFSLPLSGRSPDMTELLLTGTLSINSISKIWRVQPNTSIRHQATDEIFKTGSSMNLSRAIKEETRVFFSRRSIFTECQIYHTKLLSMMVQTLKCLFLKYRKLKASEYD